ncbi:flagella biosynthesis regulator Flk [Pantoea sp. A4]|uniref:flagella biosynthesis regulator Flk n=1 Tax=Pantoea sp. A4 TaxID=1225184 RepID=UPI00037D7280|nr:flagella biosynthesis regulator Flk [Pantoea sp. A4]
MQPVSGPGAPPGDRASVNSARPASAAGDQPLSPAQRTTLERLIVKITALSTLKAPELWAGIRHEAGVKNDAELQSRHFPLAEHYLQTRLGQVQNSHATRQLLQQLMTLLPQGNNRQAVSDFIRQQFGQTVLSALSQDQLRQVLTMLQNGQMAIPQPQQNRVSDRTLLPVEHQTLQQQVVKLAAATGESTASIWHTTLKLVSLKSGDPIPSRLFPAISHYLQARQTLSQQSAPTLHHLEGALRQPLTPPEQRMLEAHIQQQFQATPQTVLTTAQQQDVLNLLFSRRADKHADATGEHSAALPQPIWAPFAALLPNSLRSGKPGLSFALVVSVVVIVLLLWLLF